MDPSCCRLHQPVGCISKALGGVTQTRSPAFIIYVHSPDRDDGKLVPEKTYALRI